MYIAAITGASGAVIGIRLIEELLRKGLSVSAIVSEAGRRTICHEILMGRRTSASPLKEALNPAVDLKLFREYEPDDWDAPCASGSSDFKAVVAAPCSMRTLAAAAHGCGDSLITRCIDVALKEGRQTVLVPRETPLSLIHLENMVAAKKAGAHILPPVPGFYVHPKTASDVVDFIVGKILSLLGIEHDLYTPWGEYQDT